MHLLSHRHNRSHVPILLSSSSQKVASLLALMQRTLSWIIQIVICSTLSISTLHGVPLSRLQHYHVETLKLC